MSKDAKDYSQYFNGSFKLREQDESHTKFRLNGREVHVHSSPDYKDGKQRGKNEIEVHYDYHIPDDMKSFGKGKFYLITTYGCQMNEHDTETMKGLLEELGYQSTESREQADVILLNTCAIRENAEDKVFGELGHLKPLKLERPGLIIGVCGCMSQEESVVHRILQKHDHVDLIFGTHNIHRLPTLLQEAYYSKEMVVEVWSKEGDIIENLPIKREGIKAWVNIMYGCDKFCTYCIVPYTRGKERSRRPQDVIAEVRELARQGFQEVTLLGQNVNAYGKDFDDIDYRFGDLMDDMRKIDIPRIRFTTSHPRDFDDQLIEVLAKGGNLVEHIHLPVQSGNTEVLKKMSRKYSRDQYMELARKIKKAIPHSILTTDIIVGFPGETDEQFEDTMTLVSEIGFAFAFSFIYSPRVGTPAADMEDNVPEQVKKERLYRLNELIKEMSLKSNEDCKGQVVEVLVEGVSKNNSEMLSGRTRTNKLVHFAGPESLCGSIVHVEITDMHTWFLNGNWILEPTTAVV